MILPLLAGFAEGAGKEFSGIAEKERANKMQNDRLVAGALLDKLKDPTLSPEDHDNISRQYYKTLGVKGGDIEQIMQAHNYMRQAAQDHMAQHGPPPGNSDDPGNSLAPSPTLGAIPTQEGQGTSGGQGPLGQIPSMPVTPTKRLTVGDLKEQQANSDALIKGRTSNLIDEEKKDTELSNNIKLYKRYTGQSPSNDQIAQMLNMQPRFRPLVGNIAPRTVSGEDAVSSGAQTDLDGAAIDPTGEYQRVMEADHVTTRGFIKTLHRASGAEWVQIQTPNAPAPIWGHIFRDKQGNITKIDQTPGMQPPSGYLESDKTANHQVFKTILQSDGSETLVPVTEKTQTTSTPQLAAAGTGATPTTPLPGQGQSQSAAPGSALPKASSITPASPLPSIPQGLGGPIATGATSPYTSPIRPGANGTGIVVGHKPLTKEEFTAVNTSRQGLEMISRIEGLIKADPNALYKQAGPGSLGARRLASYMGELSDLIKRLRSGAATNESEEKFYLGQLPGAMDKLSENLPFGLAEPGLVEDKLNLHKNLFNGVIQQWGNRAVGGWPTSPTATAQDFGVDPSKVEKPNVGDWVPRFDKQEAAKNKNATPSTPLPNGPDTKIEVKAPDGQIGHLTQKQIDAAKKEGVIFTPTKK